MSRKRTWYPAILVQIVLFLVVALGVSVPAQTQGPAPNPPVAPPSPVQASDCTYSSYVLVSWTPVAGANSYLVKRSLTETGPLINACVTSSGTSCADTAVAPNSPHYFWVEAHFLFDPPGELRGPDMGTRQGPTPASPTGLQATDGSYTDRVRLFWIDPADTPEYNVRRGESSTGPFARLAVGLTRNYYDDTDAAPGITYYYQVQAKDHCDQLSAWGAMDKGYRGIGPLPPPTNVSASECAYEDRVRITWDAVAHAAKYRVYRAESAAGFRTELADVRGTHYDDDPPAFNTNFHYWVRTCTVDDCSVMGDYSQGVKGRKCCDPPLPPASVEASDGTFEDTVVINWYASAGATLYYLYRATTATGAGLWQATVSTTSWEDTTADPGVPYYYTVAACSVCGCSETSLGEPGHRGLPPAMDEYSYLPLVLR